ncbi:MAG: SLC13 family permease [Flavonifractor plautii]
MAGIAVVAAACLLLWLGGDALALTQEARIALLVLVGACVLFFTELIPLGVSALLIPVVLCLTGVLTEAEAFASLCDDTILMFAGMFVVGQAMFAIGVAHRLGAWIARWSGGRPLALILGMGVVTVLPPCAEQHRHGGRAAAHLPGVAESSGVPKKWLPFTLANASGMAG